MIDNRYSALGMAEPDVKTMCVGQCEGIGYFPCQAGDKSPVVRKLWADAESLKRSKDGWHFVKCPDCAGSGKKPVRKSGKIKLRRDAFDHYTPGELALLGAALGILK